jgi:hypothetical protein
MELHRARMETASSGCTPHLNTTAPCHSALISPVATSFVSRAGSPLTMIGRTCVNLGGGRKNFG